jgi:hypothetical protein
MADINKIENVENVEYIEFLKLCDFKNKHLIRNPNQDKMLGFIHPCTVKMIGCRGSMKTTFIINYLNKLDLTVLYEKVYFITNSRNQKLFTFLEKEVIFLTPIETVGIIKDYDKPVLFIFDDCMSECQKIKGYEYLYTRGRHMNISLISLEQDFTATSVVERRNTDYFCIFKIIDMTALKYFHESIIPEVEFLDFLKLNKRYNPLIISPLWKYKLRINFNQYFKEGDIYDIIRPVIPKSEEPIKKKRNTLKSIAYFTLQLTCAVICIPCFIASAIVDK